MSNKGVQTGIKVGRIMHQTGHKDLTGILINIIDLGVITGKEMGDQITRTEIVL